MTSEYHLKPFKLPPSSAAPNYDAIDPLDGRYFDADISRHLSERVRVAYQAYVEAALVHTLADYKLCSRKIALEVEAAAAGIRAEAVAEEEKTTQHDVKALVNCLKQAVGDEAKPFVHFGATSYDIVATGMALQMRTAIEELVVPRLQTLQTTLLSLVQTYADTVQIGRTHGQHAVPITFGFFLAEYVSRLGDSMERLAALGRQLNGKFSGAVGAYNAMSIFVERPMQFEKDLLAKLHLAPAPYSKQIIPAENVVRLLDELTIAANVMANLSHDMRHLQRSEIAEVRERFETGQTGSSTMAHKRNPWNFENVISMSKQVNAQLVNANLNVVSEHQRDLTDSASGRFYNVSVALVAAMAQRLGTVMAKLEVDEANMQRNLRLSQGSIAAEPLYLLLEKYGHTSAHEVVKQLSLEALETGRDLYVLAAEPSSSIAVYFRQLTAQEKQLIKNPKEYYVGLAAQKARTVHDEWQARSTSPGK